MHKSRKHIFIGPLGAAWAIGMGVLLFVIDSLANAMPNTSFMIMGATLVSVYTLVSPKAIQRMMMQAHNARHQSAQDDEEEDSQSTNELKTA